jgi:hypothetical protein
MFVGMLYLFSYSHRTQYLCFDTNVYTFIPDTCLGSTCNWRSRKRKYFHVFFLARPSFIHLCTVINDIWDKEWTFEYYQVIKKHFHSGMSRCGGAGVTLSGIIRLCCLHERECPGGSPLALHRSSDGVLAPCFLADDLYTSTSPCHHEPHRSLLSKEQLHMYELIASFRCTRGIS